MSRLIYAFLIITLVGRFDNGKKSNSLSNIYNCIMNYEINLIKSCEQYYDDNLEQEEIPKSIVLSSFPPFDSSTCIKTISNNLMIAEEYLNKHCIVIKLNTSFANKSTLINPITYERVRTFLGSINEIEIPINLLELDIKKSGVEVTEDVKSCENKFSDIYNFSSILLNEDDDRAVAFCHIQSHSEQKIAYFLRKLGEVWYLEIKEHM